MWAACKKAIAAIESMYVDLPAFLRAGDNNCATLFGCNEFFCVIEILD